jgi:hypothetical protein
MKEVIIIITALLVMGLLEKDPVLIGLSISIAFFAVVIAGVFRLQKYMRKK